MANKLITPASSLAVSLDEAKLHCRVDVADDDALITALITTATEYAEMLTGRAIMPQTWEVTFDEFPDAFEITRIPVASVSAVFYVDVNGFTQAVPSTDYTIDTSNDFGPAYIVPVFGKTWPATRDQINAVMVRYVAGYASAAAVPESIKSWIKLQVGAMYDNRQASSERQTYELKFADRLLDRFVVWSL